MAKPPSSLPPSGAAPLRVSLLLGSFVHSPAAFDLFDMYVPSSAPAPVHPEEALYHPRPELAHTFRPEPNAPLRFISAFFAGLVLSPWIVLFGLVRVVPFPLRAGWALCIADNTFCVVLVVGCRAPSRTPPLLTQYSLFCALTRSHRGPPVLVLDRASSGTNTPIWLRGGHAHPPHG